MLHLHLKKNTKKIDKKKKHQHISFQQFQQ